MSTEYDRLARPRVWTAADTAEFNAGTKAAREAYTAEQEATGPRSKSRLHGPCADCRRTRVYSGRALCSTCYRRHSRAGTLAKFPTLRGDK